MLNKKRLLLLVLCIFIIEILIYIWFYIRVDETILFEKCTRNSGRVSAGINLILLCALGHFGLKTIYKDSNKKELFKVFATLFAINHLIHFFYIYHHFQFNSVDFNDLMADPHGTITFISILLLPVLLWLTKSLNKPLYWIILFHFFNITYFLLKTFNARVKPENPEYMHQIGIVIMIVSLLYILLRVYIENRKSKTIK